MHSLAARCSVGQTTRKISVPRCWAHRLTMAPMTPMDPTQPPGFDWKSLMMKEWAARAGEESPELQIPDGFLLLVHDLSPLSSEAILSLRAQARQSQASDDEGVEMDEITTHEEAPPMLETMPGDIPEAQTRPASDSRRSTHADWIAAEVRQESNHLDPSTEGPGPEVSVQLPEM
eukprot:scaffold24172_cov20-Prasinocladus_malaysianus.AAC.1